MPQSTEEIEYLYNTVTSPNIQVIQTTAQNLSVNVDEFDGFPTLDSEEGGIEFKEEIVCNDILFDDIKDCAFIELNNEGIEVFNKANYAALNYSNYHDDYHLK